MGVIAIKKKKLKKKIEKLEIELIARNVKIHNLLLENDKLRKDLDFFTERYLKGGDK